MKNILKNRVLHYFLILGIGILLGWLVFNPDPASESTHVHEEEKETTYTCSMHPQIRQGEPGDCPICGMALIPLSDESGTTDSGPFTFTMSADAIALSNIQTHSVESVLPERELNLTGKIAINEQKTGVITANYSGRIDELFVDFTGQTVTEGEKLATIYSPELVSAQQELIEAAKFKEINPALYDAAKEKLRLWKITESQIEEIESRGVITTQFEVYADKSGVVTRRNIAKGDFISRGSVLFEIADLSTVWVLLDAYESDLPFLRQGQRITISVASIPGREFSSSITFIDPLINPQTRTAAVRAVLNNSHSLLKPEMFVNGRIKGNLPVRDRSLVIPKTALLWTGKRSVVYVKVPDTEFPVFEMREITLGASLGEYYAVEDGLAEGEKIVSNGVFAVDAAAQLRGNYSMMHRPIDTRISVPEKFRSQLSDFVNQYFELQNSLVQSDFQMSQSNARELKSKLDKIEAESLSEKAKTVWDEHLSELNHSLSLFIEADDIEDQRNAFSPLSNYLIESAETFGLTTETVYVTYCPMALDDEGAYWLSEIAEINNPYFGDRMLRCGEVKREIGDTRAEPGRQEQDHAHQH